MNKIPVTAQQRFNALQALNEMWPSVPKKNVSDNLDRWRESRNRVNEPDCELRRPDCNSICCFGGWCEWWPPFRAQMNPQERSLWTRTAELFGPPDHYDIDSLFGPREYHVADGLDLDGVSDHKIVTQRLKWLLANSEVVE